MTVFSAVNRLCFGTRITEEGYSQAWETFKYRTSEQWKSIGNPSHGTPYFEIEEISATRFLRYACGKIMCPDGHTFYWKLYK